MALNPAELQDNELLTELSIARHAITALIRATPEQRAYLFEDIAEGADLLTTAAEWVEDEAEESVGVVDEVAPVALLPSPRSVGAGARATFLDVA